MFAWAEKQLERISKTVAPVPLDPGHQFKDALASGNVTTALALLSRSSNSGAGGNKNGVIMSQDGSTIQPLLLDAHKTILNTRKGSFPIHVACEYGAIDVVQVLIGEYGVSPEQVDTVGNTPLHYATSSSHQQAFHLVQILVQDYNVSLSVKNMQGMTPYDVCTVNKTRQWLLPIQLQRETPQCLDDGGVGLPPGMDMGGIKLSSLQH